MENKNLKPIAYIKEIQGQVRLVIRYIKATAITARIYEIINNQCNFFKCIYRHTEQHQLDKTSDFLVLTACNELYDKVIRNKKLNKFHNTVVTTLKENEQIAKNECKIKQLKNAIILMTFRILLEDLKITHPIVDLSEKDKKIIEKSIDEYHEKIKMLPELPIPNSIKLHVCDWQQKIIDEREAREEGIIKI